MYYVSVNYTLMHKPESEMLDVCLQKRVSLIRGVQRPFTIIALPMSLVDRHSSDVRANLFELRLWG